jgi:hypothetical protein
MRIVFHLCLLAACVMGGDLALAASHGHRPNAAAARSAPASEDAGKSTVTSTGPAEATSSPSAAGGKAGDAAAPIDTSITVNQGHRIFTGKEAAAKRLGTELGKLTPGQAKPRPPVQPIGAHVPAHRNAVGTVVAHADPRTAAKPAATAAARASAPPALATQTGAVTAPTPASHDVIGTATPKTPTAAAAEHGAAALRTVTANGPSITGTGVAKPSTATAAVGGPAKAVAAAVGGASFHPKHP